jgi:hypothetical protein
MLKLKKIHTWHHIPLSLEPDYFASRDVNFNIPYSFEEKGNLRYDFYYVGFHSEDKSDSLYLDIDAYYGFILRVEGLGSLSFIYNSIKYKKPDLFKSGMPSFVAEKIDLDIPFEVSKLDKNSNERIDYFLNPSIEIFENAVAYKFGYSEKIKSVISPYDGLYFNFIKGEVLAEIVFITTDKVCLGRFKKLWQLREN